VWAVATEIVRPSSIRAAAGVDAVVQAGAVLDDGGAQDVPSLAGPVQLGRVARRLRALGFPVVGCVGADGGAGVRRLHRSELPLRPETDLALDTAPPVAAADGLAAALRVRADAAGTEVGRLAWHTDNRAARERLLHLVASARRRVLLQSYIFDDDGVGRAVVGALRDAACRGVEVRVLVDSLWARHGSLGLRNELLAALDPAPGVDVRVLRPVAGVRDLKQREHVKLLVVDGEVAVLPGRNVAEAYYTGFDEVVLAPDTPQHQVPWVDLSTELTGPVVAMLEARFAAAWVEAGGAPLVPSPDPRGEGGTAAWLVTHRSLADATTLDAFRVLFEAARREIVVLNTFPLQHELQHALLARLRAGVAVRFLTGHVRPRHQGGRTPFPGSAERDLMTDLVHGRLDALAEAGAEVTAVSAPPSRSWDPSLGAVLPHLHAKLVIVDREVAAVGSANVDVASAYWESELLLVVRDRTRVGALADWADGLAAAGVRFEPADPAWRERAARRAWLSQSWPSLVA
jgi:cardiolipin synthase